MTRPSDGPATAGGFLFNVNHVFIATVAASGLGFITAVLLARSLGPEGRGVTALYQAAVSLGFAFLGGRDFQSAGFPSNPAAPCADFCAFADLFGKDIGNPLKDGFNVGKAVFGVDECCCFGFEIGQRYFTIPDSFSQS